MRSSGLEAERVARERRPEHGDDADQRGGDPEVGQRPGDRPVLADVRDALAELPEDAGHGMARLTGRAEAPSPHPRPARAGRAAT